MADSGRSVPPEARAVVIVFQDYALFPHLAVADNVGFGLIRPDRDVRLKRVAQVPNLVGLEAFGERYPHELSGGQQQRGVVANPAGTRVRAEAHVLHVVTFPAVGAVVPGPRRLPA
jgi:iron(III) transport system ATP-binding protein